METLITGISEALLILSTALMAAYLVRQYIFTFTVAKKSKKNGRGFAAAETADSVYQPKVSILIPARNEERVRVDAERLLL